MKKQYTAARTWSKRCSDSDGRVWTGAAKPSQQRGSCRETREQSHHTTRCPTPGSYPNGTELAYRRLTCNPCLLQLKSQQLRYEINPDIINWWLDKEIVVCMCSGKRGFHPFSWLSTVSQCGLYVPTVDYYSVLRRMKSCLCEILMQQETMTLKCAVPSAMCQSI